MKRLAGALVAPLATPAALAVAFVALSLPHMVRTADWSPRPAFHGWLLVAVFATPAAYLVTWLVGIPLLLHVQRQGRTDLGAAVAIGLGLGVAPFALFDLYVVLYELVNSPARALWRLATDFSTAMTWLALGAVCGVATAWSYWSISRRSS